jgi:hypothetical protein
MEQIGKNAVKLKLPIDMRIHPVISTAFIKSYKESEKFPNRNKDKPPPVEINNQLEYEVEEILNKCICHKKIQYLVLWKNYKINEATWEPLENLTNANYLIKKYETNIKNSQRSSRGECDDLK